jgi:galactokinase
VSLVAEENVEIFLETVRADFYEKDLARMGNLATSLFSTKPGPGAALCNLN